jgi:hypothetical protein
LESFDNKGCVTGDVLPVVGFVRVTGRDTAELVADHVDRFALVVQELVPVAAAAHCGFEKLRDSRVFGEVSVGLAAFS